MYSTGICLSVHRGGGGDVRRSEQGTVLSLDIEAERFGLFHSLDEIIIPYRYISAQAWWLLAVPECGSMVLVMPARRGRKECG